MKTFLLTGFRIARRAETVENSRVSTAHIFPSCMVTAYMATAGGFFAGIQGMTGVLVAVPVVAGFFIMIPFRLLVSIVRVVLGADSESV